MIAINGIQYTNAPVAVTITSEQYDSALAAYAASWKQTATMRWVEYATHVLALDLSRDNSTGTVRDHAGTRATMAALRAGRLPMCNRHARRSAAAQSNRNK